MVIEQGGTTANYTGKNFEKFVEDRLIERGYTFIDNKKFKSSVYLNQPIYSKHYLCGKTIYGTDIHSDFVIFHPEKWKECLIIECKWQQSKGSVDEKYPYLVSNIQERYPHKTIVVIDGEGYKKGGLEWIKSQIGNNLLGIMNMQQFSIWANKGNL